LDTVSFPNSAGSRRTEDVNVIITRDVISKHDPPNSVLDVKKQDASIV